MVVFAILGPDLRPLLENENLFFIKFNLVLLSSISRDFGLHVMVINIYIYIVTNLRIPEKWFSLNWFVYWTGRYLGW